mmetsp:Transcript_27444/g.68888  ORF Transcript_27444/g.68888 Transcript_27444/m.68888 type:complete len:232 (+) Transcript_27444:1000-1695(+)
MGAQHDGEDRRLITPIVVRVEARTPLGILQDEEEIHVTPPPSFGWQVKLDALPCFSRGELYNALGFLVVVARHRPHRLGPKPAPRCPDERGRRSPLAAQDDVDLDVLLLRGASDPQVLLLETKEAGLAGTGRLLLVGVDDPQPRQHPIQCACVDLPRNVDKHRQEQEGEGGLPDFDNILRNTEDYESHPEVSCHRKGSSDVEGGEVTDYPDLVGRDHQDTYRHDHQQVEGR